MSKWDFRDVSWLLQKFRQFLLGRKHHLPNLHGRFPPRISSRSIPLPNISRGPVEINKYYDQWYCDRSAKDGVKPPVIGPLGEGPAYPLDCTKKPEPSNMKPNEIHFAMPPTPGITWWWDGHCYYELVPEERPRPAAPSSCQPATVPAKGCAKT